LQVRLLDDAGQPANPPEWTRLRLTCSLKIGHPLTVPARFATCTHVGLCNYEALSRNVRAGVPVCPVADCTATETQSRNVVRDQWLCKELEQVCACTPTNHTRARGGLRAKGGRGSSADTEPPPCHEPRPAPAPTISAACPQLATTPNFVWIRGTFPDQELTAQDPSASAHLMAAAAAPEAAADADSSPAVPIAPALAAAHDSTQISSACVACDTTGAAPGSEVEALGATEHSRARDGSRRVRMQQLLDHIKLPEYAAKFEGFGMDVRRCEPC
jgi:hypothetical protein